MARSGRPVEAVDPEVAHVLRYGTGVVEDVPRCIFSDDTPHTGVCSALRGLHVGVVPSLLSDEAPDIAGYYKGAGSGLRRHIKNRTADPDMKILNISFRELVTDIEGPIRAFYEFCGMALSEHFPSENVPVE